MKKFLIIFSFMILFLTTLSIEILPQEAKTINIVDAYQKGLIDLEIIGAGLEEVEVKIYRKTNDPIKIIIPVGTFFENRGKEQDMVATQTVTVDLTTKREAVVSVPSACVDIERDVPGSSSRFNIYPTPKNEDLKRLMNILEKESSSKVVRQVAIWILMNDINREELDSTYIAEIRSIFSPFSTDIRPAASNEDVINAIMLLEKAGINIFNRRIVKEKLSAILGLSSSDKKVFEYSAKLLGYTGERNINEYVIEILCKHLKDSNSKIRKVSAEVAKNFKDNRIIESLIESLKDTSSEVRKEALESLKKITGQDFEENYEKWKNWWDESKKKTQLETSSQLSVS